LRGLSCVCRRRYGASSLAVGLSRVPGHCSESMYGYQGVLFLVSGKPVLAVDVVASLAASYPVGFWLAGYTFLSLYNLDPRRGGIGSSWTRAE